MTYQIRTSRRFERRLRKFLRDHPDLKKRVAELVRDLEKDPFQPRLRLHRLSGDLSEFHSIRLTYQYQVLLILLIDEYQIRLVDIGSHDEVYR